VEPNRPVIHALNGARGVAALVVALFHFALLLEVQVAPGGYLAVDFFFVLSGFVIAHAYDRRLGEGLGSLPFLWLRLRRFYPLYALGMVLAAAWLLFELIVSPPAALNGRDLGLAFALATLFLPYRGTSDLFPLNPPAWSLLFELAVNFAYGALYRWLTVPLLLGLALVSGIIFACTIVALETANVGVAWEHVLAGVPRTIFSFSVGVVIFRLRDRLPQWRFGAAPVIAAMCLPMVLPWSGSRILIDLAAIFLLFPVAVALLAKSPVSPISQRAFTLLGALSFPLYALHYPFMIIGLGVASQLPIPRLVTGLIFLAAAVILSLLVHFRFDEPLQRLFARRQRERATAK
jgi:peptidoglycan/LPS O-acetylase OafA/YrhL